MKILATSDTHQMGDKFRQLVEACEEIKPDVTVVAGDIFPKDQGILEQYEAIGFLEALRKYAKRIKASGSELALMMGNDDNQNLINTMLYREAEGLWYFLHDKVEKICGYEFVGMPWVPDHPFGYKYWVKAESPDNVNIDPVQFCKPLLVNLDNEFETIKNYYRHLKSCGSIKESLQSLVEKVENIRKSIWLIHAPPYGLGLDVIGGRSHESVGSKEIARFIAKHQPMLTIHGHIHESPEVTGCWWNMSGDTYCIQGGQLGKSLHYTVIEIDGDNVKNFSHSIYGDKEERHGDL